MRQILCLIARVQCHFICCLENGELGKQSVVLHLPAVYVCWDSKPLKLDHTRKLIETAVRC